MTSSARPPVLERFLRYAVLDTQSDRESTAAPSSEKQLRLAELLVEELRELGVADARIGRGGVVYGSLPASAGCEPAPAIGFVAHMDTSPDAPGANVKPRILRYEGGDVVLNEALGIRFEAERFPEIRKYAGEDVVFTDGTTLLGADDKAGIAAIVEMVARIQADPSIPHAKLCIGFTPDEEVARGTEDFDIDAFGARYAYTFDGGEVGGLEYENFNGGTAWVTVSGVGVHPGSAKGKMVNSLRFLAKYVDRLPPEMSPECTSGHEGFLHPNHIEGSVVSSTVRILVRDHDRALYEAKKALLVRIADEMNAEFPQAKIEVRFKDSYENMKTYLDRAPKVLEVVREAYRRAGLTPVEEPIRGGTDGARLSARGLPTPNVFTGGLNFHGIYECLPVKSLEKACDVALELARLSAEVTSLD